MSRLRRPPAEIAELRQRRDELSRQLAVLQKERDLETRAADKLAQDATLEERNARLADVEAALEAAELVAEADSLERKQSWKSAIEKWERVAALAPTDLEPAQALSRLRQRQELDLRLDQVTARVMPRRQELAVWDEVRASLQQMRASGQANEEALILIGELIDGKLDAAAFDRDWRSHSGTAAKTAPAPTYKILANRLQRGDVALFVGSEVARDFHGQWPGSCQLAAQLAEYAEVPGIGDSLATVAEYYELSPHGRTSLVRQLRERLAAPAEVPLYKLLAEIASPLVVVSVALDSLLEAAFRAAGKSFVVVSPLLASRTGAAELVVQWSDAPEEKIIGAEELSGLLLREPYSLIFKVRGAVGGSAGENSSVTPTLAEREHFLFARRQQVLLPTYLVRLLANRGLLILGLAAGQWEDRLLLDAVLDRRQTGDKPFVARQTADRFEEVYWQKHANRFEVSLPELTERLAHYLRPGPP